MHTSVLRKLDRQVDAWGCLQNAVELNRISLQPTALSGSLRRLKQLVNCAKALSMDTFDQLPVLQEAVSIRHALYDQDKDRHREALANSLSSRFLEYLHRMLYIGFSCYLTMLHWTTVAPKVIRSGMAYLSTCLP